MNTDVHNLSYKTNVHIKKELRMHHSSTDSYNDVTQLIPNYQTPTVNFVIDIRVQWPHPHNF